MLNDVTRSVRLDAWRQHVQRLHSCVVAVGVILRNLHREVIGTRYGCSVLLKGGHQKNDASDLLWQKDKKPVWFHGVRIDNPNTHGTGCTLSSAIASNLAKGRDLETSVEAAKRYISGALAAMLDLGSGSGPMNHGFAIKEEW